MSVQVRRTTNKSRVSFYGPALKADTQMVVNDILHQEDEFQGLYFGSKNKSSLVLEPPFNPVTLQALTTRNNVLAQAISAMEVNIDGTGWSIEMTDSLKMKEEQREAEFQLERKKKEQEKRMAALSNQQNAGVTPQELPDNEEESEEELSAIDQTQKMELEAFFNEPYPEVSFITIRRQLRYDIETTGNGYLEVLRNLEGRIIFLRYLDSTTMRLCRLGDPVQVEKEITRNGTTIKAKIFVRERRFVQKVGTNLVFFKEYGSTRNLSRDSGEWIEGRPSDVSVLASEVIHFTCEKDVATPYGVPRWINQLPSIMGSRKAEEFNLEFFDAGGIPPAAVFVQGGQIANDVTQQLQKFFSGKDKSSHRVAVVEVQSTSGSLDSSGGVQVKTERFGAERQADGMFQNYDKNCEEHVRVGFRLPPLFVGRAQDYNFATAQTAYMVTEAQVFQPERLEFDEIINAKIVRSFGITDWKFVSKPLTMKNVDVQLTAIDKVATFVDDSDLVDTINDIAGLNLEYSQEKADAAKAQEQAMQEATMAASAMQPEQPQDVQQAVAKSDTPTDIAKLVSRWGVAVGMEAGEMSDYERQDVLRKAGELEGESLNLFNTILASKTFVGFGGEFSGHGLDELACGCSHAMAVTKAEPDMSPLAEALLTSNENTQTMIEALVKKLDEPRPDQKIDLHLDLKLPEKKAVTRKAVLPDGKEIVLKSE